LDKLVAGRSIKRRSAVKSSVEVNFIGLENTVIPTGTKVATKDGIIFETIESRAIGDDGGGFVTIHAECTSVGTAGNVKPETVTEIIDTISGVTDVTNAKQAKGGQDYESDELLRTRTINQFNALSLGIEASYNAWAVEAHDRVLKAKPQQGHSSVSTNTIILYVVKDNGGIFSQGELDTIKNTVQKYSPLGLIIDCRNIVWTEISVIAQVRLRPTYDLTTVRTHILNNLNIYLDYKERDWGDDIEWSDIYTLINNTEGVDDISIEGFAPSENVIVSDYSLPLLGEVTVTQW